MYVSPPTHPFLDINTENVKKLANDFCRVEFPNREEAIKRMLLNAPSASSIPELPKSCVIAPRTVQLA